MEWIKIFWRNVLIFTAFVIFLGYLIVGFEILVKSYQEIGFVLTKENKDVYAVLAIIFASQVAGFAVLLTIVKNHFFEKEKDEKAKQNNRKISKPISKHAQRGFPP